MKALPKLAIVGRPNVGKSALFNRLCKKRISIVDEAEGTTRDRIYATADFFGRPFELIDTGGIDLSSDINFNEAIRRQAEIAMEEADAIVLLVDGRVGLTDMDEQVARILRRKSKPVVVAVNKIDNNKQLDEIHIFRRLGFENIVGISAFHGLNVAELLEMALGDLEWEAEEETSSELKVAVIGRPNVGKSTLMNYLLDEERCVVSPIAGTTRDSIDVDVIIDNKTYRLIDTAGIRRKKVEADAVDKFAAIRTEDAIDRADICLLMLDAAEGLNQQEKRIAQDIEERGKGCILLFNKWDTVKGFRMEHCLEAVHKEVPFLKHCPTLFISALSGRNVDKIFAQIDRVAEESKKRITTGELNRFLEKAICTYHPPMLKGKRLRIYYIAQIGTRPPRFIMFVNKPALMVDTYKKYLINAFRDTFQFTGVPLAFALRGKVDRHTEEE